MSTYSLAISSPKDAIAARILYKKQVKQFLDKADGVLKNQMDKLMENFRLTAPAFYEQYFIERRIYDGATNYTEVKASITNSVTGLPVQDVVMTLTSNTDTYTNLSNAFGIVDHKQMKANLYDVTFSKTGFISQTIPGVNITLSEVETFSVSLVPQP